MKVNLHHKQTQAQYSPATEILFGGAAGPGKSHLLRVAAIEWALDIPHLQIYLFRRTFPDLWKNHMEGPSGFPSLLAEFMEKGLCKINYSKNYIEFKNGSKIMLCHLQYEKDLYNYQGAEIHVLLMDELTQFSEEMYRYLRGRVRMIGVKVPEEHTGKFPRIISGSNPGGLGHSWVKRTFIDDKLPMSCYRQSKKEGGMLRQFIPARMDDNPDLMRDDPNYGDRLEGLGNKDLVRAYKEGDWDIVAGGIIDDLWNRDKHILPALIDVPSSWTIDRSFDWGSSKPFSVGWWAETDGTPAVFADGKERHFPRGTLIRLHEWYGWNGEPNTGCKMLSVEIARGILKKEEMMRLKGRVKAGPADSSIYDDVDGKSIAGEMSLAGVRWEKANKKAGSRVQGWELLRQRLTASLPDRPEDPGLYVTELCTHFIRTMPVLPRDKKKPDDVDSDAEDHIADEVRYRCLHERKYLVEQTLYGM